MSTLRLVLSDQLSRGLSALRGIDPHRDVVLMTELWDEATYVRHHKKKLVLILSAMRHFADALRREGVRVDYVPLDAPGNSGSLTEELRRAIDRHHGMTEERRQEIRADAREFLESLEMRGR